MDTYLTLQCFTDVPVIPVTLIKFIPFLVYIDFLVGTSCSLSLREKLPLLFRAGMGANGVGEVGLRITV